MLSIIDSAGIPMPGGVDVLVVVLSAKHPQGAYLTALAAIIGSVAGCMILYSIARKGGQVYLDAHTSTGAAARFYAGFVRYGIVSVFIPALLPIPLPLKVFVLSAGALGVRPLTFFVVILIARILRYLGLAYLGVKLGGHSWTYLREHGWYLLGFAALLCVALYLVLRLAERFHRSPATAE